MNPLPFIFLAVIALSILFLMLAHLAKMTVNSELFLPTLNNDEEEVAALDKAENATHKPTAKKATKKRKAAKKAKKNSKKKK